MAQVEPQLGVQSGPIAYMASNGVAANLCMFALVIVGLVSLTGLERKAWPAFEFNMVEVAVTHPGATPEEIEESIIVKIEERVRSLDVVKNVDSTSAPSVASVRMKLKTGTDMSKAIDDVESAIARIQTFPVDAERPVVREMSSYQSIMRMVLYGDASERTLKELAYGIEDGLTDLPNVSLVETTGIRDYEISIDVSLYRLRELGLTLQDVANTISASSLDLSGGDIKSSGPQVRVRTIGQRYEQHEFEDIIILSRDDGTVVRLGDIATVRDGFRDLDLIIEHENQSAVFVEIYRVEGENVMDVASAVHTHLEEEIRPSLPEGIGITLWNDESQIYSERVFLLLKNGLLGLLLIMITLALFLHIRLAFWVTVGLLVTFVGALTVMLVLDVAISTISLFVFVLAIGIIVDDAIVVAENVHLERSRGASGLEAAINGVRKVRVPLTFAVLTSIAAFVPLFFIPGGLGEIWRPLPIIVISMLVISLIECFFILPNHLSHMPDPNEPASNRVIRFFERIQAFVDRQVDRFVEGPLDRLLRYATEQPFVIICGAIGALIFSVSLIPAGIIPTTFADAVEGDFVTATLDMPDGTAAARTYEVAKEIEEVGRRVMARLDEDRDEETSLLEGVLITVGSGPRVEGGSIAAKATLDPESNLATIEFKLISARDREISSDTVAHLWRDEVGILPYARGVTFSGQVLNLGSPIQTVLSHPNPERLPAIADTVVNELRGIGGVFDVRSDHTPGIKELQVRAKPESRTFGLTLADLAGQIRSAFFGAEALRVQRGKEEVRVFVRLPEAERESVTDVEGYMVRTPSGRTVPVTQVASLEMGTSFPTIQKHNGERVITITADVDPSAISAGEANLILVEQILAKVQVDDPELTYTYGGQQQELVESLDALYRGFAIAMLLIFALLAIPLKSYTKPLIVMSVIPFGFVGVLMGHLILGIPLGASAVMGVLGLSGVVVNDSLVMMDFIHRRLEAGSSVRDAIVEGAKGRFRPIFLTSLTTFLGFTPLILERAIQAQFFLPFAASLGIGIMVTTALLMVLVPAISSIHLSRSERRQAVLEPAA